MDPRMLQCLYEVQEPPDSLISHLQPPGREIPLPQSLPSFDPGGMQERNGSDLNTERWKKKSKMFINEKKIKKRQYTHTFFLSCSGFFFLRKAKRAPGEPQTQVEAAVAGDGGH